MHIWSNVILKGGLVKIETRNFLGTIMGVLWILDNIRGVGQRGGLGYGKNGFSKNLTLRAPAHWVKFFEALWSRLQER